MKYTCYMCNRQGAHKSDRISSSLCSHDNALLYLYWYLHFMLIWPWCILSYAWWEAIKLFWILNLESRFMWFVEVCYDVAIVSFSSLVNSFSTGSVNAYMCVSWVIIGLGRQLGVKPLPGPMLTYCQLDLKGQALANLLVKTATTVEKWF